MSGDAAGDLGRRLRQADGDELAELVRTHAGELDPPAALMALANPFAGREVVERLAAIPGVVASHQVRRALAFHPAISETLALRFLAGLYWRDLMALGADPRVRPTLRRAADRHLVRRLPGMATGEKIAIARRAGPGLLAHIRHDPSPRVIAGVLENPRLTEGTLTPMVQREDARPEILRVIADDRRWGVRYPIRVGLCRNPRTPVDTALRLLPMLKKVDQRQVATDRRLPAPVRRRARLLSGGG